MNKAPLLASLLLLLPLAAPAQTAPKPPPTTLRGVLAEQLKSTHDEEDWFVPVSIAIDGLTAEQAKWSAGKDTHSTGQLANHLLFWNTRALDQFNDIKSKPFTGNNDETFNDFDAAQWAETVKKLNALLTAWDQAVAAADDKKLAAHASLVAHVSAHNAYHVGQIILVRKLQGSWDPAKGVK